jgi:hypothetical protein
MIESSGPTKDIISRDSVPTKGKVYSYVYQQLVQDWNAKFKAERISAIGCDLLPS